MKILVIGGTGILSSAVVDEAINQSIDVYMVNRGKRANLINDKAHLIKCDVHDKDTLNKLLGDVFFDAIIDFLVYTKEQLEYSLDLFSRRTKQYVFISSTAVYNTDLDILFNEDSPKIQEKWSYSINKNLCEVFLLKYCNEKQVNYTIIRPGVNYGNTRIPYGIYPSIGSHWWFYSRILADKPMIVWNNGENIQNLTRVEDFAIGVVGLLGKKEAYNEAFNVVGDDFYTWKQVLDCIADYAGKDLKVIDIPPEEYAKEIPSQSEELLGGRANNCKCSNEKLKKVVKSFKSNISLKEGIYKTLDYYKSHNYLLGIDYNYDGDYDRIIKKYSKGTRQFSFNYKNYLGAPLNQRMSNYLRYSLGKHKDNFIVRIIYKIKHKSL